MSAHTYEEQKQLVFKGLILLGVLTIIEVIFALFARGHITHAVKYEQGSIFHYLYMMVMIGFSLYKAYFIIYNFMHLGSEVKGMAMSIVLPMLLLVWAVIAFFNEGGSWSTRRNQIKAKNRETSMIKVIPDTQQDYRMTVGADGKWS
jgi:cytochrome c oxidase subunit IV